MRRFYWNIYLEIRNYTVFWHLRQSPHAQPSEQHAQLIPSVVTPAFIWDLWNNLLREYLPGPVKCKETRIAINKRSSSAFCMSHPFAFAAANITMSNAVLANPWNKPNTNNHHPITSTYLTISNHVSTDKKVSHKLCATPPTNWAISAGAPNFIAPCMINNAHTTTLRMSNPVLTQPLHDLHDHWEEDIMCIEVIINKKIRIE